MVPPNVIGGFIKRGRETHTSMLDPSCQVIPLPCNDTTARPAPDAGQHQVPGPLSL